MTDVAVALEGQPGACPGPDPYFARAVRILAAMGEREGAETVLEMWGEDVRDEALFQTVREQVED